MGHAPGVLAHAPGHLRVYRRLRRRRTSFAFGRISSRSRAAPHRRACVSSVPVQGRFACVRHDRCHKTSRRTRNVKRQMRCGARKFPRADRFRRWPYAWRGPRRSGKLPPGCSGGRARCSNLSRNFFWTLFPGSQRGKSTLLGFDRYGSMGVSSPRGSHALSKHLARSHRSCSARHARSRWTTVTLCNPVGQQRENWGSIPEREAHLSRVALTVAFEGVARAA
jgi:hypothetical protein